MTRKHDEIPTDAEVLAVVQRKGSISARDLVSSLEAKGHEPENARRAVQRCLNRGSIRLGPSLNLIVAHEHTANAA